MRISETDLQCEDIIWFGADSEGSVFACFSAGCGNVPEYVCRSREETDLLLDYFMNMAPAVTVGRLLVKKKGDCSADDALLLAGKGIHCFDITGYDRDDTYCCIAVPESPLKVWDLPEHIRRVISDHVYDGTVSETDDLTVDHAYQ